MSLTDRKQYVRMAGLRYGGNEMKPEEVARVAVVMCLCMAGTSYGEDSAVSARTREQDIEQEIAVSLKATADAVAALTQSFEWESDARRQMMAHDDLAEKLIAIAEDRKRSHHERRQAILMLGRMGNESSLEYLVANLHVKIPLLLSSGGDGDRILETPCVYALAGFDARGDRNWNAARVCVREIRKPVARTRTELRDFAIVLRTVCGHAIAGAMLSAEGKKHLDANARTNLNTVSELVKP